MWKEGNPLAYKQFERLVSLLREDKAVRVELASKMMELGNLLFIGLIIPQPFFKETQIVFSIAGALSLLISYTLAYNVLKLRRVNV